LEKSPDGSVGPEEAQLLDARGGRLLTRVVEDGSAAEGRGDRMLVRDRGVKVRRGGIAQRSTPLG